MPMNEYQLAGLIGTTSSAIMQEFGNYQATAMRSSASTIQGGGISSAGNISASQMEGDATMMLLQREQEQLDLYYQSQMYGIDSDILGTQIEILETQANNQETIRLKQLNDTQATLALNASYQNRSGATVQNLQRARSAEANSDIRDIESQKRFEQSNIRSQQAQTQSKAELSKMSIDSSKIASRYEQAVSQIQSNYTRESSRLTAQGMVEQAKIASRGSMIQAGIGAVTGGLTAYSQYKSIK
jgi:hypothetical protein